jgi:hypothetical protein
VKDHILSEIQRLASVNGAPPGQKVFAKETGIGSHEWRGKLWARWGDALTEAGFQPNKQNERLDPNDVLAGLVDACRHYGHFPTQDEVTLLRNSNPSISHPNVMKAHFGKREDLIAALAKYTNGNTGYEDVAAMLPKVVAASSGAATKPSANQEGFVYLFKSGDFYKIGRSDDLERRIKEVGIKLPEKLVPIHSIRTDDPSGIEAYWHRRFAAKRANGEWFKLTSQDVAAFRKRKYQ